MATSELKCKECGSERTSGVECWRGDINPVTLETVSWEVSWYCLDCSEFNELIVPEPFGEVLG